MQRNSFNWKRRILSKRTTTALTAIIFTLALAAGSAVPALAATGIAGKDCVWPTHAYLELRSSGDQYIGVMATGGAGWSQNNWPSSATVRRNYVNSLAEDAAWGEIDSNGYIQGYGWGCSI